MCAHSLTPSESHHPSRGHILRHQNHTIEKASDRCRECPYIAHTNPSDFLLDLWAREGVSWLDRSIITWWSYLCGSLIDLVSGDKRGTTCKTHPILLPWTLLPPWNQGRPNTKPCHDMMFSPGQESHDSFYVRLYHASFNDRGEAPPKSWNKSDSLLMYSMCFGTWKQHLLLLLSLFVVVCCCLLLFVVVCCLLLFVIWLVMIVGSCIDDWPVDLMQVSMFVARFLQNRGT